MSTKLAHDVWGHPRDATAAPVVHLTYDQAFDQWICISIRDDAQDVVSDGHTDSSFAA